MTFVASHGMAWAQHYPNIGISEICFFIDIPSLVSRSIYKTDEEKSRDRERECRMQERKCPYITTPHIYLDGRFDGEEEQSTYGVFGNNAYAVVVLLYLTIIGFWSFYAVHAIQLVYASSTLSPDPRSPNHSHRNLKVRYVVQGRLWHFYSSPVDATLRICIVVYISGLRNEISMLLILSWESHSIRWCLSPLFCVFSLYGFYIYPCCM